jgi:hypothetical protein
MPHARQQIRDYVATAISGGTLYGTNVFKMRSHPLDDKIEAAVCIYTVNEAVSQHNITSAVMRIMTLTLEAFVVGSSESAFESVDDMSQEIEDIMSADRRLGGLVKDCQLTSAVTDINTDGRRAVATLALNYEVTYRTGPGDAGVIVP